MEYDEVLRMKNSSETRDISEKIKRRIIDMEYPDEIRKFLLEMLILEFEHIDEARPRLNDEYEAQLKKYALDWKEE